MVKEIYDGLINNMTWSYSRLKCFESCKYQWYMKYICGENESPMFYSSYGSFVHKLIDDYYSGKITRAGLLPAFLADYQDEVQGEIPSVPIAEKYITKGINYFSNFEEFPYNLVDVERKMQFKLNGYNFVGIIDYLGEKDGEYYIVDNKSRELKPRSKRRNPTVSDKELDDMLVQLYLYSTPIYEQYGKYPKALCFNCFKARTFIEEKFNEKKYHEAIDWAMKTIDQIKAIGEGNFDPSVEFFKCKYLCGLNDSCIYWQMS